MKQIHILTQTRLLRQPKRYKTSNSRPEQKRSELKSLKLATKQFIQILKLNSVGSLNSEKKNYSKRDGTRNGHVRTTEEQ